MKIVALCHTCAKQHGIDFDPIAGPGAAFGDWLVKHPAGHDTDFVWPQRSGKAEQAKQGWLHYLHNADVKTAYGSSAAYTISLASLATSSTLLVGREGTAVSNTTNLYLDYLIAGQVTVGTSPTASTQIECWTYGSQNDTPLYPDSFTGSDAAKTMTSAAIKASAIRLLSAMGVDTTTSNRAYFFAPISLAGCFGGTVPKNHGIFVTHSTAVNLNSTGGNHIISYTPAYATVT